MPRPLLLQDDKRDGDEYCDTKAGHAESEGEGKLDGGFTNLADTHRDDSFNDRSGLQRLKDGPLPRHLRDELTKRVFHYQAEIHRVAGNARKMEIAKLARRLKALKEKTSAQALDVPSAVKAARLNDLKKTEETLAALKNLDPETLALPHFRKAVENSGNIRFKKDVLGELKKLIESTTTEASTSGNATPENGGSTPATERASNRIVESNVMKKAINRVLEGVANTTERWAGIQSASSLRGEKRRLDKKANTARKKAKSSTEKQDARWSGEDSDVNAAGYDSEDFAKARTVHGPLFLNSQDSTLDDVFSDESMSDFDPELGFDEDDDGITIRRRDLANRTLSDAAERAKMKPKKKNRMGQARRRLLHEQEYGREARHLQTAVLDKVRKKAKISASVQAEENLHPSWAAKRAPNRTSLEAFAGKKVVFDDDGDTIQRSKDWEEDTPSVTSKPLASVSKALGARWPSATSSVTPIDEGLHPSWAAKRREAEIAARGGAGTKIVFF